jgi:conjugal transfer pilus assembly protein TraF
MTRRSWLLCFSYLLLAPHLARGSDFVPTPEPPFFIDKERGWFWREIEPQPRKQANSKPTPESKSPPPDSRLFTSTKSAKPEPAPLTAEWFRKNLERYRDKAIDDPSPENVAAYYYLQRVMMDKAQRFTDVARHVVMSDPLLDENQRRPIATFAANEANHQAGLASEQALGLIARQAGILFFFRSDCPYCHIQAPLLSLLEMRFGFKVYAVSLDGKPMPGGLYADFHIDRGQAHLLGVVSTPALFLMKPPAEIVQLSQGTLSLDDLSGRILLAAKDSGWIDEATFEATRGQRTVPAIMPPSSIITAEAMNSPADLVGSLQRQAGVPSSDRSQFPVFGSP